MPLKEKLQEDLVKAMKAKDEKRLSTLRMIRAEILKKEKEGTDVKVDDSIIIKLLQGMVKQHKDAIEEFDRVGRSDRSQQEREEMQIIQFYLPVELSDEEIIVVIRKVIQEIGATSEKDLGKVMGKSLGELKTSGKMVDGARVNQLVRQLLQPPQ